MVQLHRERGFTFHVYSNDHQPAHVHVKKNGGEIKISICDKDEATLICITAKMSKADIHKALDIADDNLAAFREKWKEYHGPID